MSDEKNNGWQMSDEELGTHVCGLVDSDEWQSLAHLGAAVRALFPQLDATPKRDELAEVLLDAYERARRKAGIIDSFEAVATEARRFLSRERDLIAKGKG